MQSEQPFRILVVDLASGGAVARSFPGSAEVLGGSGLAAALYERYAPADEPPGSPRSPLIFAVGPLAGLFPMMSKVVCAFRSPHTGQYAESHAGGRLAHALALAGYDALVVTGRATAPAWVEINGGGALHHDAAPLAGLNVPEVHARVRAATRGGAGRISVACTGPAADNGCTFACVTVDRHRHFGRLGAGAVMAAKNLKALAVVGDGKRPQHFGPGYAALRREMHDQAAHSPRLDKYRNVGTAQIVSSLNALGCLPWKNLQEHSPNGVDALSGENVSLAVSVRRAACTGCPVGCIRLASVGGDHEAVGFDFEHMACCGSMLALTDPADVLALVAEVELQGMDVMSAGVCLAWACEATERGVLGTAETGVPLRFGHAESLRRGLRLLGGGQTPFWRALARGARHAAAIYGGEDYACVLGQEMAGYASGPTFFAAQAMNFRHSHLDNACYSYDLECLGTPGEAVDFLLRDEHRRVMVNCMVGCLFGRHIYTTDVLARCLEETGHRTAAHNLDSLAESARRARWRLKLATGFDPGAVRLPKRFSQVATPNGPVTAHDMEAVRLEYALAIRKLVG